MKIFVAGETRIKERIEDYNRIKEKLKLPKDVPCNTYKNSSSDISTRLAVIVCFIGSSRFS